MLTLYLADLMMNQEKPSLVARGIAGMRPDFKNGCISGSLIFLITLPLLPWLFLSQCLESHRNQIGCFHELKQFLLQRFS